MTRLLSDEVWQQLDPGGARLSRRQTWRVWLVAAAVTVLLVAATVLWRSGLIVPRLEATADGSLAGPGVITYDLSIRNDGLTEVRLLAAGRSGPGLELVQVASPFPVTLGPGDGAILRLFYRVTDCAAVPTGPWPVPVRVERPWGTRTTYVNLPAEYVQARKVEWQRARADEACASQE